MSQNPDRRDERARIQATNREFAHYDQVDKRQEYGLAEVDGREEFDEDFELRCCDLSLFMHGDSAERRHFALELGEALGEIGFAILVNHGIDPALHEAAERETLRLFTEHTLERKLRFRAERHGSVNQGYFPLRETSDIHPDLVEGWVFCRRAFDLGEEPGASVDLARFWPRIESELVMRRMCQAQEGLIVPVMQAILMGLGCDPSLFDERLMRCHFGLRLNYYPPLGEGELRSGAGRLLGHEDTDLFTFLPAPRVEGLQVLDRRSFRWVRLKAPPGSIVLNTGDYMQRISNDLLPSTTHRVSTPRDLRLTRRPRVSFPMNVYLWEDELLEVLPGLGPPKYEPVQALRFHTRTTAKYYGDDYAVSE